MNFFIAAYRIQRNFWIPINFILSMIVIMAYAQFFYFYDIFPYITPLVVYPIGMIAQTGSVGCTILVTIERYVAVCLPLKAGFHRRLCTHCVH